MQCALELEKKVNQALLDLHKVASEKTDPHLCDFLESHYLNEQVEAIKKLGDHITNLSKMDAGKNRMAEYLYPQVIDKEKDGKSWPHLTAQQPCENNPLSATVGQQGAPFTDHDEWIQYTLSRDAARFSRAGQAGGRASRTRGRANAGAETFTLKSFPACPPPAPPTTPPP
ncbi:ferritin, middle subunit [Arapaima gigas]